MGPGCEQVDFHSRGSGRQDGIYPAVQGPGAVPAASRFSREGSAVLLLQLPLWSDCSPRSRASSSSSTSSAEHDLSRNLELFSSAALVSPSQGQCSPPTLGSDPGGNAMHGVLSNLHTVIKWGTILPVYTAVGSLQTTRWSESNFRMSSSPCDANPQSSSKKRRRSRKIRSKC